MYLYEIPQKSKIFCECSDGSKYIIFNHLDGMYSHCTTEKGGTVHLAGGCPLKETEGGYKIIT
jgi:hypothetical protein